MFYNWHTIGHNKELTALEHDIRTGSIAHAYLFIGPGKIGKFHVARAIAGILQCPNDYCHACPTCIQITKQSHPDTLQFDDDGESLKIETVRQIIERLSKTAQSRHKIVLLENIERLTIDASNALLKILEEPPRDTIFLLTAQFLRNVLPTIVSRVRVISFRSPPEQMLKEALEKMFPEKNAETREHAFFLAQGRSGLAITLLKDPALYEEMRDMYRMIEFLDEQAGIAARIMHMQQIVSEPAQVRMFLSLTAHYYRQKMKAATDAPTQQKAIEILHQLDTISELMKRNVNTRLLLEHLMLHLS